MANFAVAAGADTIERANKVMELYSQDGDKKEDILNRILGLAENEAVRGTHPELEESLRAVDATVTTLIKQINGVVAGQDSRINDLKNQISVVLEEKSDAIIRANLKEEAAAKKEEEAFALAKEAREQIALERKKADDDIYSMSKELEQAKRETSDAKAISEEKTANNDLLVKKMSEMEADLEEFKELKKIHATLENEISDLKIKMREVELQKEIEIEKAISKCERELNKNFEAEKRELDKEVIRLQLENERLNALISKNQDDNEE